MTYILIFIAAFTGAYLGSYIRRSQVKQKFVQIKRKYSTPKAGIKGEPEEGSLSKETMNEWLYGEEDKE